MVTLKARQEWKTFSSFCKHFLVADVVVAIYDDNIPHSILQGIVIFCTYFLLIQISLSFSVFVINFSTRKCFYCVNPFGLIHEGNEGWYLPNCQSNLVIALHALSLLFCYFISTTAYLWADLSLHLPLAVALPVKKHLILWFELTSSCSWAPFYNHWIRFPAER